MLLWVTVNGILFLDAVEQIFSKQMSNLLTELFSLCVYVQSLGMCLTTTNSSGHSICAPVDWCYWYVRVECAYLKATLKALALSPNHHRECVGVYHITLLGVDIVLLLSSDKT